MCFRIVSHLNKRVVLEQQMIRREGRLKLRIFSPFPRKALPVCRTGWLLCLFIRYLAFAVGQILLNSA